MDILLGIIILLLWFIWLDMPKREKHEHDDWEE